MSIFLFIATRDDAERHEEEDDEDLIEKAETDFFAIIDTEKKSREAKEKQQQESLKQMNRTLTKDGRNEKEINEQLLEVDEVFIEI